MAFKLKLKKTLSYSGVVSADIRSPFVVVETQEEADVAQETGYFDLVESIDKEAADDPSGTDEKYTKTFLKDLGAEAQKDIIIKLGGDLEGVTNGEQRIDLIIKLQDEAGE